MTISSRATLQEKIQARTARVVVIGQGYVGLPLALEASKAGYHTVGYEVSSKTVSGLTSGHSHIDGISPASLEAALASNYSVSDNEIVLEGADVIVVCVPTPLSEAGGPDLGAVEAAANAIRRHLKIGTLVILESTTYPGTTEELFAPLVLAGNEHLEEVHVAFSPERIDPGNASFGLNNTPKVVGGIGTHATDLAAEFYRPFVQQVVRAKGAKEAEMAKMLENTFRHINIALVNEMLRFSNDLNIDLWDAIDCAETKPFGFMAFRPGPGVGGHCIPVDPSYLSHRVRAKLGYSFRMVELAEEINGAAPLYVGARVWRALNSLKIPALGARILLLGITYKPNISDMRESPAHPLAEYLADLGAEMYFHDPFVTEWPSEGSHSAPVTKVEDVYEGAREADAVVLLQNHAVYDLNRLAEVSKLLLDTRGAVSCEFPSVVRL